MVRAFYKILASKHDLISRRHRRQFAPSITTATSCLEDRVVLSGGGAHAAARPLADTPAGQKVANLFESMIHTAPTSQQLTHWVNKLRHGGNLKPLRKDLAAVARAQAGAAGGASSSSPMPIVAGSTTGATPPNSADSPIFFGGSGQSNGLNSSVGPIVARSGGARSGGARRFSLPSGLTSPFVSASFRQVNSASTLRQSPLGTSVSTGFTGGNGVRGLSNVGTVSGVTGAGTTRATTTTGIAPTVFTNGTTAGTTSGSLAGTVSPLGALDLTGMVPTPGNSTGAIPISTIGPVPGTLTFGPLAFGPLAFTPTVFPTGPANASPMPLNGTLPFTGTPANPSPLPANGTLPFTGTPANPSPVPLNGTLPFTGTPANPSPVPTTGGLF